MPMTVESMAGAQTDIMADFARLAERLRQSTVRVIGRRHGSGSGVIWRGDGLIITNSHVVAGKHAQVQLADGRVFVASITKRDQARDLAELVVEAANLPAVAIGDSGSLRVGELVLAVGNPLGHIGAVTTGIIHAISRRWVQADLRLAPGNSGGPLANALGEVIGINSRIAGGLALALASKEVERFISRGERRARPRLGIEARPVPVPLEDKLALGLMVLDVYQEGAADHAGFLIGDILIGVCDQPLQTPDDLAAAFDQISSDSAAVELSVIRGGKHMRLTAIIRTE